MPSLIIKVRTQTYNVNVRQSMLNSMGKKNYWLRFHWKLLEACDLFLVFFLLTVNICRMKPILFISPLPIGGYTVYGSPYNIVLFVCETRNDESVTVGRSSFPMCTVYMLKAHWVILSARHGLNVLPIAKSHKIEVKLYNYTTVKFYISKFIFNDCEAIYSDATDCCMLYLSLRDPISR